MAEPCPTCGETLICPNGCGREAELVAMIDAMRAECDRRGFVISWDGTVCSDDAAGLIGIEPDTLVGWRRKSLGPVWIAERHGARHRIAYALEDIASWRLAAREKI